MVKILDLEQRTDEWLQFRLGKISGSKAKNYSTPVGLLKAHYTAKAKEMGIQLDKNDTIPAIKDKLGKDAVLALETQAQLTDHIYKLIAEQVAEPINPNDYEDRLDGRKFSEAVRGEILEDEAREAVAKYLNKKIIPGRMWQSEDHPGLILSPDGEIVSSDGVVREAWENKALINYKMVKVYYEKEVPKDYWSQCLHYFVVNKDLETLYFSLYSDRFAMAPQIGLQVIEIKRKDIENEIETARAIALSSLSLVEQEVLKLTF